MRATPRPWDRFGEYSLGQHGGDGVIGTLRSREDRDLAWRAVNAHDDLVGAARFALRILDDAYAQDEGFGTAAQERLRAALAKARGESA